MAASRTKHVLRPLEISDVENFNIYKRENWYERKNLKLSTQHTHELHLYIHVNKLKQVVNSQIQVQNL